MKKKCLVITFCFPPYPSPESFITSKLLEGLSEFLDITVLTVQSNEEKKKVYYGTNIKLIKVKLPSIINFIINLPRLPIRPDRFVISIYWLKKKLNEINLDNYDIIFTRSQFHSSHILGLYIKKIFPNKKWIASFSDPWSKNAFQKNVFFFTKLSDYYEKKVLKKADKLIFPLINLRNHFNKQTADNIIKKSLIVRHSYSQFKFTDYIKKNKVFTIRFFGKIYAERNLLPLLEVLKKYYYEDIKIKGEFYIDDDYKTQNRKLLKKYEKYVSINSYVNNETYLRLVKSSDLLVILDGNSKVLKSFFQSKVVDYLGSKKMILHIGKCNTINKKITLKNNGYSCENDIKNINTTLKKVLKNKNQFRPNLSLIKKFDSKYVAQKLFKDLDL